MIQTAYSGHLTTLEDRDAKLTILTHYAATLSTMRSAQSTDIQRAIVIEGLCMLPEAVFEFLVSNKLLLER